MLGLVLEGGGAKGAFHAGAVKALIENGYVFDGVMGTSIGALNGVMIAQGDFEACYNMWKVIKPSMILDVDDDALNKYFKNEMDFQSYKYFLSLITNTILNKGLSVNKIMVLLKDNIDEDRLRKSPMDFGVVTVISDNGKFEPIEIFKEEIPYGRVANYIMASAYYPAFKTEALNGKSYVDGGLYDNLPINPLIRRGYDHIIAIRTGSDMPSQKVVDKTVKVDYIDPSEPLGDTLAFTHHIAEVNLKIGYYDAMRYIKHYKGRHFYIEDGGEFAFEEFMAGIPQKVIEESREIFGLKADCSAEELMKVFLTRLSKFFKISTESTDFEKLVIGMEYFAKKYKLEKFHVYTLKEFVGAIVEKHTPVLSRKTDWQKFVSRFFDDKIEHVFNLYLDAKALELEREEHE